jgi:Coenzyme PQQ synthesis protein D (PqqD)
MSAAVIQVRNLEVHEVPDGYIVYQSERDRVHYLNKTAAIIFEFCDGSRGADDIVVRVATAFELGSSAHEEIRAGLDSLVKEGLVLFPSK